MALFSDPLYYFFWNCVRRLSLKSVTILIAVAALQSRKQIAIVWIAYGWNIDQVFWGNPNELRLCLFQSQLGLALQEGFPRLTFNEFLAGGVTEKVNA